MGDERNDYDFVLGKISGKLDGVLSSMNSFTSTFNTHSLSDEKNFDTLRQQMQDDKKEMTDERLKIAKWTGAAIVIMTILSYLAPSIISKFF